MSRVTCTVTMVVSHLLLVNHFLFGLTYNSPKMAVHPNAIDGLLEHRSTRSRHPFQKTHPMVSYNLAGQTQLETNSIDVDVSCGDGCSQCSEVNGCLSCRSPFFLTLRRNGPRQLAFCERTCPKGFYKKRYNKKRFCASCRLSGCRVCHSANYCSVCDDEYTRDARQGSCTKSKGSPDEIMSASMSGNDIQLTPLVYPPILLTEEPKRSTSTQTRHQPRPLGNNEPAIARSNRKHRRRRNRRRRKPHGRRRRKLRKRKHPNTVENNAVLPSSIPVYTSKIRNIRLNQKQNRTRLGDRIQRRRNRRRRKRKRKYMSKSISSRNVKLSRNLRTDSNDSEVIRSQLIDNLKTVNWRNFRPQVRLARPSRHIRKESQNTTVAVTSAESMSNASTQDHQHSSEDTTINENQATKDNYQSENERNDGYKLRERYFNNKIELEFQKTQTKGNRTGFSRRRNRRYGRHHSKRRRIKAHQ